MKVWLYYRLSRDEDEELNSLTNQRNILVDYAKSHGHEIVGESFDDNVSGMTFEREGIDAIYDAVAENLMEAILVKDLSRLGRHRLKTAMFIEFLREKNVRVLSATEGIDSFNEQDDLIIAFKQMMNDFYARDISKKIRTAYTQKQKQGIVLTPPFGYWKDKNTGEILIVEEAAEIVRTIFQMYVDGYGFKLIAQTLNSRGMKSPSYYQEQTLGKGIPYTRPEISHRHLWDGTAVKRILENEFYAGTLMCHKTSTSKINKTRQFVPEDEQFRHEHAVPAVISEELWQQAHFLLTNRPEHNFHGAKGQKAHRYTGLITCADCGASFIAKKRRWRDKPERIEYVCSANHRYGNEHCTPHRIHEEQLDRIIYQEILSLKDKAEENWYVIEKMMKEWKKNKRLSERQITKLTHKIEGLNADLENVLLARIRDPEHESSYSNMITRFENEIEECRRQIREYETAELISQRKRAEMKESVELLDEIVAAGEISDIHLRMLVDHIYIQQCCDGRLKLQIDMMTPFACHLSLYKNVTERISLKSDKPVELMEKLRKTVSGEQPDEYRTKLEVIECPRPTHVPG